MAPPGPATRLLPPLVLALAGVARGTFTVVARPRVALVAFGGSVAVNCSRSPCPGGDNVTLALETPLGATPGPGGPLWKSFRLENVSRWEPGDVTCAGSCGDSRDRDSVSVTVYQPPQRVTLDPVAPAAVGDSVTLRCHVLGVAPVRNLTVTLRRGAETLRTQTFGDSDSGGVTSVAVSHVLTVTRGDHGQDVTCHAELSLRPLGPLFARAAVPVTLSVFALPDPPQLLSPSILEVGTVTNVTCVVTGAFPAGDVVVTAALDRRPLDVTVGVTGDTVTATAAVAPGRTGRRELSCTARVASVTRTARRWLRVYSFPEPTLELSPPTAPEGTEVTVTCQAGVTEPPTAPPRAGDVTGVTSAEGNHADVTLAQGPWADVTGVTVAQGHWADVTGVTMAQGHQADVTEPPMGLLRVQDVTGVTWAEGHQADATGVTEVPPTALLKVRDVTGATPAQGHQPGVTPAQGHQPGVTPAQGHRADVTEVPPPAALPRVEDVTDVTEVPPPVLLRVGDVTNVTLAQGHRPRLQLRVVARRDQERFWCRATIRVGDEEVTEEVTKEVTARLDVLYPPELPPGACPASHTWLRGSVAALSCRATGNPVPTVTCHRRVTDRVTDRVTEANATAEATTEVTTEPLPVTRDRAGTYVCKATNALGTRSRKVTVRVEYPPSLSEPGCPSRRVWVEGQRRQLECHGDGDPPPRTRCHRHGDVHGGGTHRGDTRNGDTHDGDVRDGGAQDGGAHDGGTQDGDTRHGGIRNGGTRHSDTRDSDSRDGGTRDSDTQNGGTHHGDTSDGKTRHGGSRRGGTQDGGTHDSDIRDGGLHDRGTHHGGIRNGDIRGGGTPHGGGATQNGGTHHGGIEDGGTHRGDTHDGDTHHGDTQQGGVTRGGGRVVTRADGGRYVCRATNRHGVAVRSVIVTVESPPRLSERGCPERRRWLEGTRARLGCAASGNPAPRVTCHRVGDNGHPRDTSGAGDHPHDVIGMEDHHRDVIGMGDSRPSDVIGMSDKSHPSDVIETGDSHPSDVIGMGDKSHPSDVTEVGDSRDRPYDVTGTGDPRDVTGMGDSRDHRHDVTGPGDTQGHPWVSPNVTRGDAGLYRCRATNAHGTAVRNVTVTVEYPPSAVTLRVLPSAAVPRGVTVTVTCGSRGVPGVTLAWSHPGAANVRLSRDNSTVTVTGATAANRGRYTCTASNRHGRSAASVTVTVDESWLVALVALGTVAGVTALALAAAGAVYLKTTACKKGEYNVRDAEGSSEATCLHRGDTEDIFGIQLTQT